jgi:hypothetical protein
MSWKHILTTAVVVVVVLFVATMFLPSAFASQLGLTKKA